MSAVAELDASLQALKACKPPGVTKSRIASITALCVENVKSESVLVQKIFTHFKRTPGTHKLGVLYVIDSVTRQWIDKASASGQTLSGGNAADGTFAAGVHRVTELLPILMNDLIQTAPDDQKEKIVKLIDIWERGNIFSNTMLADFKAKLMARPSNAAEDSTTPAATSTPAQAPAAPQDNTASQLLAQLQSAQPSHAPITNTTTPSNYNVLSSLTGANPGLNVYDTQQTQAKNPAAPLPSIIPSASTTIIDSLPPDQAALLKSIIPAHILSNSETVNQYLALLQHLVQLGVPADQWPLVLSALQEQMSSTGIATNTPQMHTQIPGSSAPAVTHNSQNWQSSRQRSRSPTNRRDSPVYGKYDYRQRPSLKTEDHGMSADKILLTSPKWTDYDPTLAEGTIRVLSRTLFVGGATATEQELRDMFSQFGLVQTVIVNAEKRHAFVKMCNRAGAVAAKSGMENASSTKIRSTRWGVGFGPRDCSDYQTGISVIPIERLTEADRKWVLTAEFGGTGGKALTTGLVIEEPDIEIGAGVSSKAISRRVAGPDASSNKRGGSGSQNSGKGHDNQNRRGRQEEYRQHETPRSYPSHPQQYDPNGIGVPPAVPGFGFQFPTGLPSNGSSMSTSQAPNSLGLGGLHYG